MKFTDLIDRKKGDKNYPKKELIFLGVNPIIEEMSEFARNCYDMLITEENLQITIIHERDTENY